MKEKSKKISFRVSEDEAKIIFANAEKLEVSVSEYLRFLALNIKLIDIENTLEDEIENILNKENVIIKFLFSREDITNLYSEIYRIGSNLNQGIRAMNTIAKKNEISFDDFETHQLKTTAEICFEQTSRFLKETKKLIDELNDLKNDNGFAEI